MKKILSLVSSAVLALAVALPAPAQTARKLSAAPGATRAIEQKAAPAEAAAKGFHVAKRRTLNAPGATPTLRRAMASARLAKGGTTFKKFAEEVNLPDLRGSVTYQDGWSQNNAPIGLYHIKSTSTELMFEGPDASYGGVEIDGIYYATTYINFWGFVIVTIEGYNVETGELVYEIEGDIENVAPAGLTVDPTTGTVYGITFNANGDGLQLTSMSYSEEAVTSTAIAPLEGSWNTIVCDADGQLYGISYVIEGSGDNSVVVSSTLNKIDKTTGAVTPIGVTGQLPQYLSSAVIDHKSGRMFWNVCSPDENSYLCEVNLSTGAATVLGQFELSDEILGMYVTKSAAEDGAPAAVTGLEAEFVGGSLEGTVKFTAPSTLFDGTATSGELTYTLLANDVEIASAPTTYGATVTVPVKVDEAGRYVFSAYVTNAVGDGPKTKTSTYIGHGVPAMTTATLEYTDGNMNLTWQAVTKTVDGGYINPEAVTYSVTRYPDEVVVVDKESVTSFSEPVAEPDKSVGYYYEVVAHNAEASSAAARSNTVLLGKIYPPYINDFADNSALAGYTIIDANEDGKKWKIVEGMARMEYSSKLVMDDWLITPPVMLEAGKAYRVSFDASSYDETYPERFEVKYGAAPTVEAMTNVVMGPTIVASKEAVPFSDYIVPEADGVYYIGIHGISDIDEWYLYIDNLAIDAAVSAARPGAAAELKAVPDPDGANKVTVSFKAPAVDMAEKELAELTKVELRRDGQVIKTFENPVPGKELSYDDTAEESGPVSYSVQGFNTAGEGKIVSTSARMGVDLPADIDGINIVETATEGEVTISWDAVTTDQNGNPINSSLVSYILCVEGSYGWVPMDGVPELTTNSYTFQAVPAGEQDFVQYAVFAKTAAGTGMGDVTAMIPAGTPYKGMNESFANGSINHILGTGYSANGGSWDIYTVDGDLFPAQDDDNGFAAMKGSSLDSSSALFTGKIDLTGSVNPGISFYTYNIIGEGGAVDINEVDVYVKQPADADWTHLRNVVVNSLSAEEGWHNVLVPLDAYADKIVQVRIQATTKLFVYTGIDNIKIGSLLGNDLVAGAINAPSSVKAGEDYTVGVTVSNNGTLDATAFSVELYADGELADTKTVDALAAGKSLAVSFERNMNAVAEAPVEYYAVVKYAADEDDKNNTSATVVVTPKHSSLPAVSDLKGEATAAGVKLTWTEPDLAGASVGGTVDFEDAESFAQEYAGWTFVDVDQSPTGGIQGTELPGMVIGETLVSFFVFDASGEEFNQTFAAHSGDKYLATMFRYDGGMLDDWAISPELDGNAQTISFYAKSYSNGYPEKIEMLYSTGSTDPADFVKVSDMESVPGEWTECTFDVPAGAKHFAIRSFAEDSFMLMLDDFTFAPAASAPLSIVGYDVYRDGVKITSEPTGETEYIDAEAADGEHTYVVVTVYETGVSKPSNSAIVAFTGIDDALAAGVSIVAGKGEITITGAEGLHVAVSALDGKLLYSAEGHARTTVNVATGVYIVKAGSKVAKVAVK